MFWIGFLVGGLVIGVIMWAVELIAVRKWNLRGY